MRSVWEDCGFSAPWIGSSTRRQFLIFHLQIIPKDPIVPMEIPVWLARTGVKCVMFSTDQVYSGCAGEGPYSEEETAPSNLYSCHKLEMEERTLDINPDTVLLRATWMYDMPKYGVPNRGNFLVNMLGQADISFSSTQHRAVTYVREVSGWIRQAALLPGGAYNYGSENTLLCLRLRSGLKKH